MSEKTGYKDAEEGDIVFFYKDNGIKLAQIREKNDFGDAGVTFSIDGNYQVVSEDVIGTSKNEMVLGVVGNILGILESKWGFLFLVVFPSLLAFLREVVEVIRELKNNNKQSEN